jgi:hypothetical protein
MSNSQSPLVKDPKTGDVAAFLNQVKALNPQAPTGKRGRLVFAMDATMSRQPSWDRALGIQAQMFAETKKVGGLDVQLVYFRGFNECRASRWVADPVALAKLMSGVTCQGGNTQIGKVLAHIKSEMARGKINAAVYVGDAQEENIDRLCQLAGEISLAGIPLFMFQDGTDRQTETAYREIARLTRGAYFRLDENSASLLAELLSAVAVYAAGGQKALAGKAKSEGGAAALLLKQLGS